MDDYQFAFTKEKLQGEIEALNEQIKHEIMFNKNDDVDKYFMKVKSHLKLSYLHFNVLSLMVSKKGIVSEAYYKAVRKSLNITLSFLGDLVGKNFHDFLPQKNKYKEKLYQYLSLLEIVDYFKLIGLQIDRLNGMLSYSSKLKSSVIDLKEKFCLVFLNAVDFKQLIRLMEISNKDYDKYTKIMKLIKLNIEEMADQNWGLYMKDPRFKNSVMQIKKGVQALEILNKLNLITNDLENRDRISKKISTWESYQKKFIKEKT